MMALVIGWQVYELTNSAFDLGLIGLIQFVPAVILTLADRTRRRPLRPPPHHPRGASNLCAGCDMRSPRRWSPTRSPANSCSAWYS